MRIFVISSTFLVTLVVSIASADYKTQTFQITTNIDRSNMLADTVRLRLDPSSITLAYNPAISTFADKLVRLTIESDIYSYDSKLDVTSYQLFLIDNRSSCYSSLVPLTKNKLNGYENIANVHIDKKKEPLKIGEKITYSDTSFDSPNRIISHELMLKFKTINDAEVRRCSGSLVIGFRYDL